MIESPSSFKVRQLDRINLRLAQETFSAIDRARSTRAGHVSRNTWVTEAIEEKLAREGRQVSPSEDRRHG